MIGTWRNNKNGNLYNVIGTGIDCTNVRNGLPVVLYQWNEGTTVKYGVRELQEFQEKFTKVPFIPLPIVPKKLTDFWEGFWQEVEFSENKDEVQLPLLTEAQRLKRLQDFYRVNQGKFTVKDFADNSKLLKNALPCALALQEGKVTYQKNLANCSQDLQYWAWMQIRNLPFDPDLQL